MKPSRFPEILDTTRGLYRLVDDLTNAISVNYALYRHLTEPADTVYYRGRTNVYGFRYVDAYDEFGQDAGRPLVLPSRRPIGRIRVIEISR